MGFCGVVVADILMEENFVKGSLVAVVAAVLLNLEMGFARAISAAIFGDGFTRIDGCGVWRWS